MGWPADGALASVSGYAGFFVVLSSNCVKAPSSMTTRGTITLPANFKTIDVFRKKRCTGEDPASVLFWQDRHHFAAYSTVVRDCKILSHRVSHPSCTSGKDPNIR